MVFFIRLIFDYAPWIYFLCSLVALYQIYRVWLVRLERRQAVFALEREKAVRDLYRIFSVVLILLVVMGTTYFSSTVFADALGIELTDEPVAQPLFDLPDLDIAPDPTDTPRIVITSTNSVTATNPLTDATAANDDAAEPDDNSDSTLAPEPLTSTTAFTDSFAAPTAAPLPTETPAPAPAPVAAAPPPACPDERNTLSAPGVGQTVSGPLNLVGTATHEQFDYYKIEYAPPGVSNFAWLLENRAPVVNGTLATVDTNQFSNGQWALRVVVVDQSGNFINPPCSVTVNVQN